MEKDAQIKINPNSYIEFYHPFFKEKVDHKMQTQEYIEKYFRPTHEQLRKAKELIMPMMLEGYIKKPEKNRDLSKYFNRLYVRHLASVEVLKETSIAEVPCTCAHPGRHNIREILPTGENDKPVICYNSCLRTLFAASKRQLKRVFPPDKEELNRFTKWVDKVFKQEIEPLLTDFDYSYSEWFNHLPANKQKLMKQVRMMHKAGVPFPEIVAYTMFCKQELQFEGGKNRAICGISDEVQYVIGPVCWALEKVATKIRGYCGGASYEDLERNFREYARIKGFEYVLQGDGSGFDLSQHSELKHIDRLIYSTVADKVWHVPKSLFLKYANAEYKQFSSKYYEDKKAKTMMKAVIKGTVFSGSSDTTLMNTIRQALYVRYTMERAGLKWETDFLVKAKGDDFMVFTHYNDKNYEKMFFDVWSPKEKKPLETDYNPYGLGIILKFLTVGHFDSIDFCSTVAIPNGHQSWKLARMPHRMNPLAHYTRRGLRYNDLTMAQYLEDLAVSLEQSCKGMPFYQSYIDAYRARAVMFREKAKNQKVHIKLGQVKETMPDDGHKHRDNPDTLYDYKYGKDWYYQQQFRRSSMEVDPDNVYAFLLNRYNMTRTDVENHRHFLMNGSKFNPISYLVADSQ